MSYTGKLDDDIFNAVLNLNGNLDSLYTVLIENDLNIDDDIYKVNITSSATYSVPNLVYLPKKTENIFVYTPKINQSIFDISNQLYGNLDYTYKIILDNNLDNINAEIAGLNLEYIDIKNNVRNFCKITNTIFATGFDQKVFEGAFSKAFSKAFK